MQGLDRLLRVILIALDGTSGFDTDPKSVVNTLFYTLETIRI